MSGNYALVLEVITIKHSNMRLFENVHLPFNALLYDFMTRTYLNRL